MFWHLPDSSFLYFFLTPYASAIAHAFIFWYLAPFLFIQSFVNAVVSALKHFSPFYNSSSRSMLLQHLTHQESLSCFFLLRSNPLYLCVVLFIDVILLFLYLITLTYWTINLGRADTVSFTNLVVAPLPTTLPNI